MQRREAQGEKAAIGESVGRDSVGFMINRGGHNKGEEVGDGI